MKKLFVAILALGALASCQKEDVPTVEAGMKKTIEINILNISEGTRSTDAPTVGGDTEKGEVALCAKFDELNVLFAKADGTIMYEFPLYTDGMDGNTGIGDDHEGLTGEDPQGGSWTDGGNTTVTDEIINETFDAVKGTRRWHNVPSDITRIAVVRYEAKDLTITPGSTKLGAVEALATNQALNIELPVTEMALYGEDTLEDTGETHRVGDAVYHVWKAEVNVKPAFTRFEVRSIKCSDLGNANEDVYEGTDTLNPTTYGFDELLLKSLKLTCDHGSYTAPGFGTQRLYGSYNPSHAQNQYDYVVGTTRGTNEYKPTNGAWSWNLAKGTFKSLVLDIDAYAYDYQVSYVDDESDREFPLTVIGLATTRDDEGNVTGEDNELKAGNIYYIDLVFTESNISENEAICVDVEVTVNAWKVAERYPIYK